MDNSNNIFDTSSLTIKKMSDDDFYMETTSKLQEILQHEFRGIPYKQQIKKTIDGLNFACPFCGDSATDIRKKRAHFILKGNWAGNFKCFNCGKFMKIHNFFKSFDVPMSLSAITYVNEHVNNIPSYNVNSTEITSEVLDKTSVIQYSVKKEYIKKYSNQSLNIPQVYDTCDSSRFSGYINTLGESFELKIKNNDIYTKNLLELIKVYINDSENIENINIDRVINGQKPLDTYRIIFNRIVIKRIRGKFRFYVQILYEGRPWKLDKNGNLKNKQGTGRIGIDYGTSTIAVVSESKVIYKNLAEEANNLKHLERQLKILQRKMDRSRRSTNPDCFNSDGTYKKGTKIKVKSRNYKKLLKQFREINRKLSCIKKYEIGRDTNIIRSLGDQIYGEHMNFQGLAKRSKNTTVNRNTGKINKKKRFGKSISNRCPGLMVSTLKNKFGNGYHEVNTWEFKASQYNHITNTCIKKKLSQRIQELDYNGETITIQRDLYSAFLLMNSNNTLDKPDLNLCNITFENFIVNHTICINNLKANNIKVNNSKY